MENYKLTQYEVILEKLGALEKLNAEIERQRSGMHKNIQDLAGGSTYTVEEIGVSGAMMWDNSVDGFEYWMGIQSKMNEILDN